jgi:hypothetical protein
MQKLKQGMAAIVLVASLGLIVPGSFGGPAAADVDNSRGHNPNLADLYYFDCDVVGVTGDYETRYELASTFNAEGRHIQGTNLVLMSRFRYDIKDDHYEVVQDPTETAVNFDDPDTYWFDSPGSALPNGGNPKGWKTVRCTEIVEYGYSPFPSEATPEFNEEHDLSFVQTDECEVFGDLEDPSEVDDCVTYLVTETNLYDVTISGNGPKAKSASADGAPSADRAVKAKHGKQRGKGKRGR